MESVAQKMTELPLHTTETPPSDAPDQKNLIICYDRSYELPCKNLESVAQKMAKLLH